MVIIKLALISGSKQNKLKLNCKSFPFQSLWWERRAFPLKEEDTAAFSREEEGKEQTERPSTASHGEVCSASVSENGHLPEHQSDGVKEHKFLGLGLANVKKNR